MGEKGGNVQKDAHWIQLIKKQELLYVRLTPYSYATKPSSEFTYSVQNPKSQNSYLTHLWNRISSYSTGQESSCIYLMKRFILFSPTPM